MIEPALKRAMVFVDGQNLFHHAKDAFGYIFPNYNVSALASRICADQNWNLSGICFYTGVPDPADNTHWNRFWVNKTAAMRRQGIQVFTRALKYRNKAVKLPDGSVYTFLHGEEKGVDVRIALDIIGKAISAEYDVALVFSQDQDLSEVANEIRVISSQQDRWIRIACAYPSSPTAANTRGINKTQWIKIDRALYDACIDSRDYR